MDKYFLVARINSEMKGYYLERDSKITTNTQESKTSPPEIRNIDSPKTMKRINSRDNFIKYQWSWTL